MSSFFPVTHSILSTSALMDAVAVQYAVGHPLTCRLLSRSMNDTYLLTTHEAMYILRAYRRQWRSLSEILYECDLLLFLRQQGIAVSVPVARRDGRMTAALEAPEGSRHIALFTYAPGQRVPLEEAACWQFGS